MKKILLIIVLGMFLISLASASTLGTFKQSECIDLYQFCDDCTYVNLTTIKYPTSINLSMNEEMTKTNQNFNYTFCDSSELGDYNYVVCGDKRGSFRCEEIDFKVTPSGNSGTDNMVFFILVILILYGINLLGFFNENVMMTVLGGMALIFLGVYIVNNGLIIYRDTLSNYIAYITIAWGGMSSIFALYKEYFGD